jgi:RNA polymerase sigma-70 factor (ECF subfamily)
LSDVDGQRPHDPPDGPRAAAFTRSYQEHRPAMVRMVIGLMPRDDAEHVVHDVFLDHWVHPHRYDPARGSLRTYLMVRTRSRAVDIARSNERRRRREVPDRALGLRVEVDHNGSREELRDALAALPAEEREPIVRAFYTDATYAQVADDLGLPEGTVKTRIRRGLVRLRGHLSEAPAT